VYDAGSGQFLTGSFMDDFMPRAGMIRNMHVGDKPLPKAEWARCEGRGRGGLRRVAAGPDECCHGCAGSASHPSPRDAVTPNELWQAMRAAERRI
jgi:hypothetical protein